MKILFQYKIVQYNLFKTYFDEQVTVSENINKKKIYKKFNLFYFNILYDIQHLFNETVRLGVITVYKQSFLLIVILISFLFVEL